LRSLFLGLSHLQRIQENQWRRFAGSLEAIASLTRRLRDALYELRSSSLFADPQQANFERMIMERAVREVDMVMQQQQTLLKQTSQLGTRSAGSPARAEVAASTPGQPVDEGYPVQQNSYASRKHSDHSLLNGDFYPIPSLYKNVVEE
jgi:hypothetical protein